MPGNLRKKAGSGKTERDYLRARKRVLQQSQICSYPPCRKAIDLKLKSICQYVDTSTYTVETAHLIPLTCSDECRELKHHRKANPWGPSANHKINVASLPPDSPLLASAKNLEPMHLKCNQELGDSGIKPRHKVSRDWFA